MHPEVTHILNTLARIPISRSERSALQRALKLTPQLRKGKTRGERCVNGHPQTPENLRPRKETRRGKVYRYDVCVPCEKARKEARVAAGVCPTCRHKAHAAECWHRAGGEFDCECVGGKA